MSADKRMNMTEYLWFSMMRFLEEAREDAELWWSANLTPDDRRLLRRLKIDSE